MSRRTRLAGLLLSWLIVLHICAINFGFDISVKLYSLFLLFNVTLLLVPYLRMLFSLLVMQTHVLFPRLTSVHVGNQFWNGFLKTMVIGMILLEVLYPVMEACSVNDDTIARPYMHGAYEVTSVYMNNDSLPANASPFRRFFIHRRGYIIFQDQQDRMFDYKLGYDIGNKMIVLQDYNLRRTQLPFEYSAVDSTLILQYDKYRIIGRTIDWRKMPALRQAFQWTID